MNCSFVRRWRAGVSVAVAFWVASAAAQTLPTIDDFFREPALSEPELSPSGRYLAVVIGDGKVGARLGVIDLDDRKNTRVVARFDGSDPTGAHWVDDDRLVFGSRDSGEPLGLRQGHGLWAVDRDGGNLRQLIKQRWTPDVSEGNTRINARRLEPDHYFSAVVQDGSGDVIVKQAKWNELGDRIAVQAHRLNTRNGLIKPLGPWPDPNPWWWIFDVKGEARVLHAASNGRSRIYWREPSSENWKLVYDEPYLTNHGMSPGWVDGDKFYVLAPYGKDGVNAVFEFDVASKRLASEPLLSIEGFDFDGVREVEFGTGRTLGWHYVADALGTVWLEPSMKAAQKEIDDLLPSTVNRVSCMRCVGSPRLLVTAFSDRRPSTYYVFDTRTRKLESIGASRPWIDPRQMATQEFVRITARDGRSIPAYVTRPSGKPAGKQPAVVLVHGGPNSRGTSWGWNSDSQFLASRGYVVIEPEFRGSRGFGWSHLSAGFKQWGQAMQDDVTDATLWAVKEANVDARRICIAGASYGGYAAMMGLVREPDLYQCAVNWVGVTDPALMYSLPYSDASEEEKQFDLPLTLGDPKKDPEMFRKISPVAQAARITKPVLMAYGSSDRRVPMEHGKQLRDALAPYNKDVEWVVYSYEGHGWGSPETRHDFWGRVEKFLDRNLNGGATAASTAAAR
jgi:dienelactone hydrolase